jgi:4-hydroxybenzoate polyprenyltransferase
VPNNQRTHIFDYFFITRPMLFFPGWNTLLAGFLAQTHQLQLVSNLLEGSYKVQIWSVKLALVMFIFMLAMGGSFILNQIADVESDQRNKKLFLVGEGYIGKKAAWKESVIILVLAILGGFLINISTVVLVVFFILITGYLYNYRPFQFKNRPVGGLILNILMGWIAFGLGWANNGSVNEDFFLQSLPYLFLNTSLYLMTTLPDRQGDQASGKKTFAVAYGFSVTLYSAVIFYLLSLLVSILLNDQFLFIINLLLIVNFLALVFRPGVGDTVRFLKMAIFFFSIMVCFKFPLYFAVMVMVFFMSRYYYRFRFQFEYPTFHGE